MSLGRRQYGAICGQRDDLKTGASLPVLGLFQLRGKSSIFTGTFTNNDAAANSQIVGFQMTTALAGLGGPVTQEFTGTFSKTASHGGRSAAT